MTWLLYIVAATAGVSLYAMKRPKLLNDLMLSPYQVFHSGQTYRVLTHGFVHADGVHLAFNLYVLWEFGKTVESEWLQGVHSIGVVNMPAAWGFPILYFGGLLVASIPALTKHKDDWNYRSLGASGAVSAVLMAFIVAHPDHTLLLFFIIPVPAILAGVLFFWYESKLQKKGGTGIAHDAHLYGAAFGLAFSLLTDSNALSQMISVIKDYF